MGIGVLRVSADELTLDSLPIRRTLVTHEGSERRAEQISALD